MEEGEGERCDNGVILVAFLYAFCCLGAGMAFPSVLLFGF